MAVDKDVEVVISGLAGCFPGSDNVDELQENLFNGVDLVTDKNCRWNLNYKSGIPNATGKIKNASKFDAGHFGIHRKQVESLDPMTCLIIERSFEAVCDAGINPGSIKGRNIGVYMGSTYSEADNVFDYVAAGNGFGILGHNRSMLASRVSYYFDINGPSLVTLSFWSCGLNVLDQALRDIRNGRCSAAIVGTPNLTMFPVMSWHLGELGLLSPDGKCKAFDSAADGYGRSDAIVVLFLQKKEDAKRVYASVIDSNVRFFSGQKTLLHAERDSIAKLLRDFYDTCGVDPAEIGFLEADGSGVKHNDREELNAIAEVLLRHRKSPLLIGSVKSNLGHTESSSNLVSIAKILIAMNSGMIPGNLHYHGPPPDIPALQQGRLKVMTENTPWPGGYACVSTIGMDGNYGHALLKWYDKPKVASYDGLPRLVVASGRTESGLHKLLNKVTSAPFDAEYIRLLHDVHAYNIVGHVYRGFTILEPDKVSEVKVEHFPGQRRPVWFVYSGMGSQWAGMGIQLMRLPVFRAAIDKCHAILEPRGIDIRHIITTTDKTIFDNILHCFVGIAAIQIGLTDVLIRLGVQFDGVIGHSVGELGCGYADGCLTAEEMILSAYARGRASMEVKLIKGMMAAVGLGYEQIKDRMPPGIEVACHNGPESSTISGPAEELEEFVSVLQAEGVFARSVNVANIAYHSRYIQPAAPGLLNYLKEIIPVGRPRSSRWISTSVPQDKWDSPLAQTSSAEYHTNNLLSSVLFEEGSRHIPADAITIEIAPHGLLQTILRRSLGPDCTNIPLTLRGHADAANFLMTAIGKLYTLGLQPHVADIYPPIEFPVSRGTPSLSSLISWEHTEDWPIANFMENELLNGEMKFELSLNNEEVRVYADHVINGSVVFPVGGYLKLAWETLASIQEMNFNKLSVVFENVQFHNTVLIPDRGSLSLYVLVQRGSGQFEVTEGKTMLASGRISVPENVNKEFFKVEDLQGAGVRLTSDDVYREMGHRGYHYKGQYKSIAELRVGDNGSVGRIQWHNNWTSFIEAMLQQGLFQAGERNQHVLVPVAIRKLIIDPTSPGPLDTELEVISHTNTSIIHGGGVQIQGLKTGRLPEVLRQEPTLSIDTLVFVPYVNPRLQSFKDFLKVCIQIAVENCQVQIRSNHCKITVIENTDVCSLTQKIEEYLRGYPYIEVDVRAAGSNSPTQEKANSFLVVAHPSMVNHGAALLDNSGGFLLTRITDKRSWVFSSDLATIAEQQFSTGRFLLLRKAPQSEPTPLVVKMSADNSAWLTKLRESLHAMKRVLLVAQGEPPGGVAGVINRVSKEPGGELVRFMFMLDKSAPPFSQSEQWYQPQLSLGLVANVYSDKTWGSYRPLSVREDNKSSTHNPSPPLPSLSLDGVEINYLGLNKVDPAYSSGQCNLSNHVDYAGRSGAHQWVMGVARTVDTKQDPLLMWSVPEAWSLEDSATIPLAYSTAYYALVLSGCMCPGQRVLVHAGTTSVGTAAISIALAAGCEVFTTVATKRQRHFLTTRFPKLLESHIYNSEDTSFEYELKVATGGEGVDIVLNWWGGERLLASTRCLSHFSRFVHLGRTNMEKNENLGMKMFLKSRSFYGVANDNVFNASSEWKQQLHDLVQQGISSGVVQPLDRSVFLYQQYDSALGMLSDDQLIGQVLLNVRGVQQAVNMRAEIIPRFRFNSKEACLIVGGTTEFWLDLATWLVERGLRKLIVAQETYPVTTYVARRVNLLRNYHNATIVLSANSATTESETEKLREEVNKYGPLVTVFALPTDLMSDRQQRDLWAGSRDLEVVRNLDCAARCCSTVQRFVCLLCEGAEGVCLARRRAGLPGLAVNWANNSAGFRLVLDSLDRLLGSTTEHAVVLSAQHHQMMTNKESDQLSNQSARLDSFLPSSLSDLLLLGADVIQSRTTPVELQSLSPGLQYVKLVPPLFLVPGLQGPSSKVMQPLASHLMYPAVALQLQRGGSIREMAASLTTDVRSVQPKGPYNIVGDTWGGVIALELARTLEAEGETTQVFLMEGAPETAQATVSELGDGDRLQTNLLCRLLNLETNEIAEELLNMPSWESRIKCALSRVSVESNSDVQLLEAALDVTFSRIAALLSYQPEGPLYGGLVTLVRPCSEEEDTCGLLKLCKNTVSVYRFGKDRDEMLSSKETADIICDEVIV